MPYLFLLFTVVPFVELMLLMALGDVLGFAGTVALVLITGALGASLARREGMRVLQKTQEELSQGQIPEDGLLGGLLVLIGGVLLVTPGVLTDVFGFSLLIPPVRKLWARMLRRRFERAIASGNGVSFVSFGGSFGAAGGRGGARAGGRERRGPRVVEVEGHEVSVVDVTEKPSRPALEGHIER